MSNKAPQPAVHKNERIGRRAFGLDKNIFNLSEDGHLHYKLDVFMDQREGGLSFDSLGVNQVIPKRLSVLNKLGVAMGENVLAKRFRGWAQLNVAEYHPIASYTPAVGEVNPHHVEILRDTDYPTPLAKRTLAIALCDHARRYEFVKSLLNDGDAPEGE